MRYDEEAGLSTPTRCRRCGHEESDHDRRVHEETTHYHVIVTKKSTPCFARVNTTDGMGYCDCWDYQ